VETGFRYDMPHATGVFPIAATITLCVAGTALGARIRTSCLRMIRQGSEVPASRTRRRKCTKHKAEPGDDLLQAGKQDVNYQDGKKVVLTFKRGEALWSRRAGMSYREITSG